MSFLFKDWIFIPLVGICTFIVVYLWAERWITWVYRQSLGQREQVIQILDEMHVDIDKKKVTMLLLLVSFGLGAIIFVLLWPHVVFGLLAGSVITVAGWRAPLLVVQSLREKRRLLFVDQMIDGLTIMANSVKTGAGLQQAMERVVENMGNPISQEFGLVLAEIRIGRSIEEALVSLAERFPKPDVEMFVTSVNILSETGGKLGETFQTIVLTIRERQKIEKKIQAMTAQGMMQGLIVTLVPFFLLASFLVFDPAYVKPLFTTSWGIFFLFIMLALQITGGLVIRKLVTIKV